MVKNKQNQLRKNTNTNKTETHHLFVFICGICMH